MSANKNNFVLKLLFPVVALVLSSCTKKEVEETPKRQSANQVMVPKENPKGLDVKLAERKPFPQTLDLPGRVAIPDKDFLVLTARVSGRIDSMPVTTGDRVKIGSPVAILWSPDLATAADEYAIAKTQNNPELVSLSETKLRSLGISAKDAVSGRSSFPLRSSMDGVVLDRKLNIGSAVNPGDQILTIGKSGSFQFQADVPPSEALQLKPGMKVTFEDSTALKATIESVSAIADPSSRLVRVRCKFVDGGATGLAQETFLKAKVILKERDSLVTSSHALIVDENSQYIFVQDGANPKLYDRVKIRVISSAMGEMAFESADDKVDLSKAKVVSEGALLLNGILEDSD